MPYFKEALFLEWIEIIVSVIYCPPSQNNDDFDSVIPNFQHILRDINKRKPSHSASSSWWSNDVSTTEWSKLYSNNHKWVWSNEPTHIQTKSSSCINLKFTDQTDLIVNSGVHASSNCHHEVVHSSFNLKGTQFIW